MDIYTSSLKFYDISHKVFKKEIIFLFIALFPIYKKYIVKIQFIRINSQNNNLITSKYSHNLHFIYISALINTFYCERVSQKE